MAVLYLQSLTGNPAMGNWVLVDLVRGGAGSNTWTGGGSVDASVITNGQIDYMVQAVDSNGNVANSTFKGLFYIAEELPPPPAPGGGPGTIGVVVTVVNIGSLAAAGVDTFVSGSAIFGTDDYSETIAAMRASIGA